ncbi:MAG: penicillin acylase family protein [Acidobacteriaceae bacterium]|nr:penicillin acylase family protein [Acidobacteriaceae bacterium]MBV9781297.1 penicillin acylase family protein [Acidobacteriaceae bacterium]
MRRYNAPAALALLLSASALFLINAADEVKQAQRTVKGLKQPVEILRDRWGVPHIYAQNSDDLFFAQGYIAANDRLFQIDLWRRMGSGRLSEVFGPAFIARDRIARLVRYRGNWEEEWNSYSPDAKQICTAFTNGINAYIRSLNGERPEEFRLAGFDPGLWTAEDVVSRVAGLQMTGNMVQEVNRAQQVARLGLATVELLSPPDPPTAFIVPHGLDLADITPAILEDYLAAVGPIRFPGQQGSNNWVIDGTMSRTGKPLLANDPHRPIQLPSLRKTVHLVAPGWNVIGAGEPALPGIALGHNEDVAFGFTIVGIDQQDLFVEKINPENANEYLYRGALQKFTVEHETLQVRGGGSEAGSQTPAPESVDLKYTVHGPVIYENPARHRAYALKWVGEAPGTAGYLTGLALARAKNWDEFQASAARYKVPSENLVYADRRGNIGWIACGLAPVRKGWEGLFPVPGDTGEYEWTGYLPPSEHPSEFNPNQHFIATANNNILPHGYSHELGFYWASPERYQRIVELLGEGSKFDIADFERMQQDTVSLVARDFIDLLRNWNPLEQSRAAHVRAQLLDWDGNLGVNSTPALIYEIWKNYLSGKLTAKVLPVPRTNPRAVLATLKSNPHTNELLSASLDQTLADIERRLGPDESRWTWGNLHQAHFRHPLNLASSRDTIPATHQLGLDSHAVERERLLDSLDLPPVPRPGDASTVNATGGPNYAAAYGASYREVIDVGDWDRSVMTNVPGESGVPGDKHYGDLVGPWSRGEYHPMPFSRKAVETAAEERIVLVPAK